MKKTRASRFEHRRRREQKTDYRARLKLLKGGKDRLVVRKFNNNLVCQVVEHTRNGDRTLFSAEARELPGFGWKAGLGNIPAAYLTGLLCGVRAGGKECVLDLGLQMSTKGSRLYAALKGAADGGVKVPFSEDNLPTPERIAGNHIAGAAGAGGHAFSAYKKASLDPKSVAPHLEEIKSAILKSDGKGQKAPASERSQKPAAKTTRPSKK